VVESGGDLFHRACETRRDDARFESVLADTETSLSTERTTKTYPLNPIPTRRSHRYRTSRIPSPIVARRVVSLASSPRRLVARVPFLVHSPLGRFPPTSAPS